MPGRGRRGLRHGCRSSGKYSLGLDASFHSLFHHLPYLCKIVVLPFHTNAMTFRAFDAEGSEVDSWTVYSVGGGDIVEEGMSRNAGPDFP